MPVTLAILGDGAWGTAIALLLARNTDHQVRLWSARPENGRLLQERRENVHLLPGVPIPQEIELTMDVRRAVDGADYWVSAIPTVYLRDTLERVRRELNHQAGKIAIISLSKGVEIGTFRRPSEIVGEILGASQVAILSGPSHAEEVSRGLPTSVVAASDDVELAHRVQRLFGRERFRVYTNLDPIGVELGGALKNIMGIAAGACDALGFGDNARSALLTRGLAEMTRFGVAHGADAGTFVGLAGLGDLITTCFSRHGRNRAVGERIGKGEKPAQILAGMTKVAEGVYTTRSVFERARQMGLDMPITTAVHRVLYEDCDPMVAVNDLLLRSQKGEFWPG